MLARLFHLEAFIDRLVRRLDWWKDYIEGGQDISLTEILYFWFAGMTFVWMLMFDVTTTFAVVRHEEWWTAFIGVAVTSHVIGILGRSRKTRYMAAYFYVLLWFSMAVVTVYSGLQLVVTPLCLVLSIGAVFLAARLTTRQPMD